MQHLCLACTVHQVNKLSLHLKKSFIFIRKSLINLWVLCLFDAIKERSFPFPAHISQKSKNLKILGQSNEQKGLGSWKFFEKNLLDDYYNTRTELYIILVYQVK